MVLDMYTVYVFYIVFNQWIKENMIDQLSCTSFALGTTGVESRCSTTAPQQTTFCFFWAKPLFLFQVFNSIYIYIYR
jgi:hypothetical protein